MVLKFTIEWCDAEHRSWQANDRDVDFHDDAVAAVLMDLERLAGGVS
jgi:hypothetical protein